MSQKKKLPLLVWDKVCAPKFVHGAGIRDLSLQNKALGAKLLWKLYYSPDSKWAKLIRAMYLDSDVRERIFSTFLIPHGSTMWNFISSCRDLICPSLSWLIHYDAKARFWQDSWNRHKPLCYIWDWSPLDAHLKFVWGNEVCHYFYLNDGTVVWKDFSMVNVVRFGILVMP